MKKFGKKVAKLLPVLALCMVLMGGFAPEASAESSYLPKITNDMFNPGTDNPIYNKGVVVVKTVAGLGALGFTLAVLIITLVLIFVSISPQKRGPVWWALISCSGAAFVFFSAFTLAESIVKLATTST
ncbi:hypothetical protein AM501_05340 [Aneurinibacillus migulanus]|uniref:hypothetical protein n=1 Tax=Aneurinibacillus migulanus TaxID=47500 RepID=UPI0005BC1000|nr:hypothetical protein [Aneurinibacillus migulanus]KIV58569.1 hypothetical protein TS64_04275 [Aneurinibacillus migulanus]KPD09259.1 hypothetical protein AM501_05340 [Aneurinibacillus migulanus]